MKKHRILSVVADVVRNNIMLTILLCIAVAGAILTAVLPPLVLEVIINTLTENDEVSFILIGAYVGLLALTGAFDAGKQSLITVFGQRVTHGLRSAMAAKLSRLKASYYSKNDDGIISSRMVNDVDTVEVLFTSGVISMVVDACKLISIMFIIFIKSRGLGILMLCITPVLFAVTRQVQKRMKKAQLENRVAIGKANQHVPETINNIRTIHNLHRESYLKNQYTRYIDDSFEAMEKSNFFDAIYSPVIVTLSAVIVSVLMVCSAMGGVMQEFFGMSVGTAVAVISYVSQVFSPLESIGMEIQNIQSAAAGITRINELLGEEERLVPEDRDIEHNHISEYPIQFKDVYFGYDEDQEILHGFSFTVEPEEEVVLTGRTGAGKSTAFKLLLGQYIPWRGEVLVYGVLADKISDKEKAGLIGYVEQSFHRIPGTVRDQITLHNPEITDKQVRAALELTGLLETVELMEKGIDTDYTASGFSHGQEQLLSIARAVAGNPRILLLDEITANLDSATEAKVLAALRKASEHRTVLSISHRAYSEKGRKVDIYLGSRGE